MRGIICGWKMIFFWWVSSLRMTPARPTSEPVPAVVGTATTGAMPAGIGAGPPIADVLEVPERAGLARHEGHDLARVERRSAAEGDDAVVAARAVGAQPRFDVAQGRVASDAAEQRRVLRGRPARS